MKVIIKPYDCLCELNEFTINGISADYDDFGEKYDTDRNVVKRIVKVYQRSDEK